MLKHLIIGIVCCLSGTVLWAQSDPTEQGLWRQYVGLKDSSLKSDILVQLSELVFQHDRIASEILAEKAVKMALDYSGREQQARALIRLTNVSFENSHYSKAQGLTDELITMLNWLPEAKYHSEVNRIAGRNFHLRGDYSAALSHYFEGLRFAEEARDTVQIGELYNVLGGVYYNQKDYVNAYNYYHRGLEIQLKRDHKLRIGRGYLNVASVFLDQKKYALSRQMLDSSMLNYSLANYEEGKAMVYTTLPEIYLAKGESDSAISYIDLAYDFLQKNNRTYYLPILALEKAKILINKSRLDEAMDQVKKGIEAGLINRQNHSLVELYLLESELYTTMGKIQQAFTSYKSYKNYSDSVLNAASIKKQTEEALNYDFNKKEFQRQLEEREKADRRMLILLGSALLVVVLMSLFYYRFRLKQKANKLLAETNQKLAEKNQLIEEKSIALQESLNEREILLKEIHHRVKNNLQVISGLLELQKEELTEDGSKAAFDEGQSRIRSISLIHQNLYQHETLGSIQFKTFVKELIEQVQEVFEQKQNPVEVLITMEDQLVDIDTAVPLGLILNELLTNSFKYAVKPGVLTTINILIEEAEADQYLLRYRDSGPGLPEGMFFTQASTLGLRLIKGLAAQVGGEASYQNNQGAQFEIRFKNGKTRRVG